jgi:hypothetical protein
MMSDDSMIPEYREIASAEVSKLAAIRLMNGILMRKRWG